MSVHAAVVPMLPLTTVLLPWLVTPAAPPHEPYDAADRRLTGVEQACVPVESPHTLSAASALPARSLTPALPDLTVTRNAVLGAKPAAFVGTKLARLLAAS